MSRAIWIREYRTVKDGRWMGWGDERVKNRLTEKEAYQKRRGGEEKRTSIKLSSEQKVGENGGAAGGRLGKGKVDRKRRVTKKVR